MVNIPRNPPQGNRALSTTVPTVARTLKHPITVPQANRVLSSFAPSVVRSTLRRDIRPAQANRVLTANTPIARGGRKLFTAGMSVASAPGFSMVITLAAAVDGRPSFREDGIVDGQVVSYVAYDVDVDNYEYGSGVYGNVGGVQTLTRTTLDRSTSGLFTSLTADAVIYLNPEHYATPLQVTNIVNNAIAAAVITVIDGGTF